MLNWLAIRLIRLYQKYVSPYKGYRCAHRLLHRGMSCSEFGEHVLQRRGLWEFWPLLQRRFRRCHEASLVLQQWQLASGGDFGEVDPGSASMDAKEEQAAKSQDSSNCEPGFCGEVAGGLTSCGDGPGGADCGGADCGGCSL